MVKERLLKQFDSLYILWFPLRKILCEKGVKAVVLGPERSETENKEALEWEYNLVFTSPKALFGSHRFTILALKNKFKLYVSSLQCISGFLLHHVYLETSGLKTLHASTKSKLAMC